MKVVSGYKEHSNKKEITNDFEVDTNYYKN